MFNIIVGYNVDVIVRFIVDWNHSATQKDRPKFSFRRHPEPSLYATPDIIQPAPLPLHRASGGADPGRGIEAAWVSVADKASAHRVLPDGRCDIILRFSAKGSPINSIAVVVEPGMGFAGIRLRPGVFHAILGLSPLVFRDGNLLGEAAIRACPPLADLCAEATSPEDLPGQMVVFVQHCIELGHSLPPIQTLRIISTLHTSGSGYRAHAGHQYRRGSADRAGCDGPAAQILCPDIAASPPSP